MQSIFNLLISCNPFYEKTIEKPLLPPYKKKRSVPAPVHQSPEVPENVPHSSSSSENGGDWSDQVFEDPQITQVSVKVPPRPKKMKPCTVCNKEIRYENYSAHLRSANHKKKM